MVVMVEWRWADRFESKAWPTCNCAIVELVKIICSNAAVQYRLFCPDHPDTSRTFNLPHRVLWDTERDEARTLKINDPGEYVTGQEMCERCGNVGSVHRHHTAMRCVFDDADDWPMVNLCEPCHVEWHQRMLAWKNEPGPSRERRYA